MNDTVIFYGSSSGKTESIARRICQKLGSETTLIMDIADSSPEDFLSFDLIILGVPTWGIGELQDDWLEFLDGLKLLDLSGRKVALFGLGDQESYPTTFANAIGILHDSLKSTGCEIIGYWSAQGYDFLESAAIRDGKFAGLVLDEENQPEMTEWRINEWLNEILPGRWT